MGDFIKCKIVDVADCSQAEIDYTFLLRLYSILLVADCSQAEIDYTNRGSFGRTSLLRIAHRLRLITLNYGGTVRID